MKNIDTSDIKDCAKYLGQEFSVVLFLFVFGALISFKEVTNVLSADIGRIISSFGVLWTIGAFFRMNMGFPLLISLITSLGIFMFGVNLYEYGFFPALVLMSIYILVLTTLFVLPRDQKVGIIAIMSLLAIIFVLGLLCPLSDKVNIFKPTKYHDEDITTQTY